MPKPTKKQIYKRTFPVNLVNAVKPEAVCDISGWSRHNLESVKTAHIADAIYDYCLAICQLKPHLMSVHYSWNEYIVLEIIHL